MYVQSNPTFETTAIFVFSKNCASCLFYKNAFHEDVKKVFLKCSIEEYTCETLQGFDEKTPPYPFLKEVKFYPCIILVRSDFLEAHRKGTLKEDIFAKLFVFNGEILPPGSSPRIGLPLEMKYKALLSDFERFYKDYLASPCYTEIFHQRVEQSASLPAAIYPSQQKKMKSQTTRPLDRCGCIRPYSSRYK